MAVTNPGPRAVIAAAGPTPARASTWRVAALLIAFLVPTFFSGMGPGQTDPVHAQQGTATPEDLEATVQRFYDTFNTGDVSAIDEILAPNWVDAPPPVGSGTDREDFPATVRSFRSAFPDLRIETRDMVTEGDQVAVRSILTGTHEGAFLGVAATGLRVEIPLIDIHRVENGLIVESYHVEDLLGALVQVGAFRPGGAPEESTPAA